MRNDDLFSPAGDASHLHRSDYCTEAQTGKRAEINISAIRPGVHSNFFLKTLCGILAIGLIIQNSEAQVKLPAAINSDTTLSDKTTYYTTDSSITIPEGITLTINEGVTFRFKADTTAVIVVLGTLIINGTEDHPVELALMDNKANTDTTRWGYISSSYGILKLDYVRVSRAHRFISAYYGAVHLNHCYAEKTYWTGTLDCIGIHYASEVLIEYCELHGNPDQGADAIDLDSITISGIVRHNSIYDFADDAFDVGTGSPNFIIEDNYAFNCSNGITIGEHSKATYTRNIVSSCKGAAIEVHTGSYINVTNCTFYNNQMGIRCDHLGSANTGGSADVKNTIIANTIGAVYEVQDSSVLNISYCISNTDTVALPGKNNMLDAPRLSDPARGNFSLSKNSPCINHGGPADTADACGTPIDIGAIESVCQDTIPTPVIAAETRKLQKGGLRYDFSSGAVRIGGVENSLRYPCRLSFYCLDGKLVKTAIVENTAAFISIRDLNAKVYIAELQELNNSHNAFRGKLLMKK